MRVSRRGAGGRVSPPHEQVIRAAIPVLVAIIAVCVENKVPGRSEVACLAVISIGVM
jgi:drug/metabolite transporter (DMT)-like permease